MVSAYNLHFDILGLIFAHLSGNDLVNVALVSKAFLNGVTPRLYHTLVFSHTQAKRYPKIVSPFASLLAQPFLAVYVRICEITAFPLYKGQPNQVFLAESIRALALCQNLSSFTLIPSVLPSFLVMLAVGQHHKLRTLHAHAGLTHEQATLLVEMRGLKSLRVNRASWSVVHLFPGWVGEMGGLTSLAFVLTPELNEGILEEILIRLPHLRALMVRNCMKVDHTMVFRLLTHTPLLESLTVTTWENPTTTTDAFAPIPNLRSLHLDTHNTLAPLSVPVLWSSILSHISACRSPLSALTLQVSEKGTLTEGALRAPLDAHAGSLKELRLVNVGIEPEGVRDVRERALGLERLCVGVPIRDVAEFAQALAGAPALRVLVDEPDSHTTHGPRPTLKHDDVRMLMDVCPKLRTVVSDGRCWRGSGSADNLHITLERMKGKGAGTYGVLSFS